MMTIKTVLHQMIEQNKTKFVRIDFVPDRFWTHGTATTLNGIPKKINNQDVLVYNLYDKQDHIVPLDDITQVNLRKFQISV